MFLQHIKFEELVRRAESDLSDKLVDKHIAECGECRANLQKLQNFFAFAETTATESVPQAATAHLLNIYHPPRRKPSFTKRLRGVLAFDDWLPEFAVNERLAYTDTRQMLFRAKGFEIDIRLNFVGGKCQPSGQIFPDCTGGEIEIVTNNFTEKVTLNEYCEFVLPFVSEGIYDFKIRVKNTEIEINQISLFS